MQIFGRVNVLSTFSSSFEISWQNLRNMITSIEKQAYSLGKEGILRQKKRRRVIISAVRHTWFQMV